MKNIKTILFLILPFLQISAQTSYLKASKLKWTGKAAFNSYELTGTLKTQEGLIVIDQNTITNLKIIVSMESLNHENSDLKSHLRSKDFFDVKNYKTAFFELTQPAEIINKEVTLIGTMTIKGVRNSESISAFINSETSTISFKTNLNRVNYGVTFNSPSVFEKLKENAIADIFVLQGTLKF